MHFRNGEKEKQFSQHTRTLAPASCCFRGQALRVRPLLLGGRAAERGLRGGRAAVDLRARRVGFRGFCESFAGFFRGF